MAELEKESPSSVSHDTSMSGSGRSEVNKASSRDHDDIISADSQLDKNITSLTSNVSNNFKSNNGVPNNEGSGLNDHLAQKDIIHKQQNVEVDLVEIEENKKNKQISQQHSSNNISSNGSPEGHHKDCAEPLNVEIENNENKTNYKKKRGVRFPDEASITCCCDPPDPWKNAPAWTTDELITAYKQSCEIHGSKPVVKILQQLHTISTPGKRKESFVLKGEKLDQKQVECIEEIFRKVQFTLIDLEATHLDDECAVALFDMIEHYESACQLNISFNRNISARGWQACSRLVRRTPTLNFLDIRNCDLNERTIPIFGRALKMGCHLTVLHMEGMALTTRPLIILVAALKMNDTLQELFLAENKLVPSDGVQLGNLLRYNYRLNLLDLRNNSLQDVGISHLCDGLAEQKSGHGLRTLVLWNNQVSYQAMQALGRAIALCASLETLNIGHNGITNEGIHQVKDGLLKTTSLLRLGLQGTRITDEGAVALAEYIADSTILLRIDLRDNDIKTGGLMALSHAMRVNNSVTRIDLDKETKKESGMKDYAEVQIRLLRDILTFQERNVQLVMEREEAERARLERLAIEAEAVREREKAEKENVSQSPIDKVVSNTESFTIIEADIDEINQQSSGNNEEELVPLAEKELESSASISSKTFSEEEEHMPVNQRPSVLFARMGLQPQESLDSPRTPSSDPSQVFQSPQKPSTDSPTRPTLPLSEHNSLSASNAPPAEMLLSPQYYPKQLARKIFSVSRVSEQNPSSPPADDLCEYDPLNVSLVSLVPNTDPQLMSSASAANPPSSTGGSLPLSNPAAVISPTSLFQDLADQTVKDMVSADEQDPNISSTSNDLLLSTAGSEMDNNSEASDSDVKRVDNCDNEIEAARVAGVPVTISDCVKGSNFERPKDTLISQSESESTSAMSSEIFVSNGFSIEDTSSANSNIPESSDQPEFLAECNNQESDFVGEAKVACGDNRTQNVLDSNCNDEIESSEGMKVDVDNVVDKINESHTLQDVSAVVSGNSSSVIDNSSVSEMAIESILSDNLENAVPDSSMSKNTPPFPDTPSTLKSQPDILNVDSDNKKLVSQEEDLGAVRSGLEVEDVELSLEEESWTALEKDGQTSGGEEKQPDFFTTLSMNGLTQELASALTSLDGSNLDFEEVSEDSDTEMDQKEMLELIKE